MALVTITLEVGRNLAPEELLDALDSQSNALHDVLVGDVTRFNLRADYSCDSLTLDKVDKLNLQDCYTLSYSFGWEAYWGCRDLNDGDTVSEEIDFTYKDGKVTFSREIVERRSTYEEF